MAQLAIAGAGAGISTLLGAGPAPGWIVGSIVGGLLFPARELGEEPQIGDRTVTSAAYGTPIPICYGRVRLSGNIIWARPIEIITDSGGGSKLGPSAQGQTVAAYASFAVAFAEGPASAILRIWADGNLIYNASGFVAEPGLIFRFYRGDEEQLPDPLIESYEGVGMVPAFRGLAYVVFGSLPLAPYGNRVPSISAEIAYASEIGTDEAVFDPLDDPPITSGAVNANRAAFHWDLMMATVTTATGGTDVARKVDLATMRELAQYEAAEFDDAPIVGLQEQPSFFTNTGADSQRPILLVRDGGASFAFGVDGAGTDNTSTAFVDMVQGAVVRVGAAQGTATFLVAIGPAAEVGLLRAFPASLGYVWGADKKFGAAGLLSAGGSGYQRAYAWWFDADLQLTRIDVSWYYVPIGGGAPPQEQTAVSLVAAHDFADLSGTPAGCWYDATDDGVIVATTGGDVAKVDVATGQRAWTRIGVITGTVQPYAHMLSLVVAGRLAIVDGGRIKKIETPTGRIRDLGLAPGDVDGFLSYHAPSDSLFVFSDGQFRRWALERPVAAAVSVGDVLEDLAGRGGVADVDASAVTEEIVGYAVARMTTVRSAMDPLLRLFSIEAVQNGAELRFVPRGQGTHLGEVFESDMVAGGDEGTIVETRVEQVELPRAVEVAYIDPDRDYQPGMQRAQKPSSPLPVVVSGDVVSLQAPIAMATARARQAAEEILYAAWEERSSLSFSLPRPWLRVEPTDLLDVVTEDGRTITARVVKTTVDPSSYTVRIEAVSHRSAVFDDPSGAAGDGGDPVEGESPFSPATALVMEELPLLTDVDDTGRVATRSYFQLAGYGQPWAGGRLYRSRDAGVSFELVGSSFVEATHGFAVTALGSTSLPFTIDSVNQVIVQLRAGTMMASVTYEQLMRGANLFALGREVMQAQTVEDLGGGQYRLSGFRRGRRGTEVYVGSHVIGELFQVLPVGAPSFVSPLGYVGTTQLLRPAGLSQSFVDAASEARTLEGSDLRPYAPARLEAFLNDATYEITWVRRTRVGGAWTDGIGTVPLSEDQELYDLQILDSMSAVVREEFGLTSPSYDYPVATLIADFGLLPTEFYVRVFQISAQVGRGRYRTILVPGPT